MVELPEGFELVSAPAGPPPLPDGFEVIGEVEPGVEDISEQISARQLAGDRAAMSHEPPRQPYKLLPTGAQARSALAAGTLKGVGGALEAGIKQARQTFGPVVDVLSGGEAEEAGRQMRKAGQEEWSEFAQAPGLTGTQQNVLGALQSVPTSIAAAALTLVTKNPVAGGFVAGLGTYGHSSGEVADRADLTEPEKQAHAVMQGIIEGGMSIGPQAMLLKAAPNLQFIGKLLGVEVPSEVATSILQQRTAELDRVAEPLTREGWNKLVADTVAQTLLVVGFVEGPVAVGTKAAQAFGEREPAQEYSLGAEDFALPEGFEVMGPQPEAAPVVPAEQPPVVPAEPAPVEAPVPVAEAPPAADVAPAPIAAGQASPELPAGFEVVDRDPTVELPPLTEDQAADAAAPPLQDDAVAPPVTAGPLPKAPKPKRTLPKKPKQGKNSADPTTMDVLEFMSRTKLFGRGYGINFNEAVAQGLDPADLKGAWGKGIHIPFTKNGATFDEMAAALAEAGYPVLEDMGGEFQPTPNKLLEILDAALRGKKIYSDNNSRAYEQELEDRDAGIPIEDITPDDLAGFDLDAGDPVNQEASGLSARANELDPDAFERIVIQFENDEAGYLNAVKELIARHEQSAEVGGVRPEGVRETPPEEQDAAAEEEADEADDEPRESPEDLDALSDDELDARVRQAIADFGDRGASELDILGVLGIVASDNYAKKRKLHDRLIDRVADSMARLIVETENEDGSVTYGDFEPVEEALPKLKFRVRSDRVQAAAQPDELPAVMARLKVLASKGDLTGPEGKEFRALIRKRAALTFSKQKPATDESLAKLDPDESTLSKDVYKTAWADALKSEAIYVELMEHVAGAQFNSDTAIDKIMRGDNPDISAEELYQTFAPTRAALREQFGDTLTLYRATGKQKIKPVANWATTEAFAKKFGDKVISAEIPVERVIAVNVTRNGAYHELIVGKAPDTQAMRDLFGQDSDQQDALNKRNRRLERKRGIGRAPVSADTAPPGDIFRDAADRERAAAAEGQTDIEDGVQSMAGTIQRAAGAAYVPLYQMAGSPAASVNTFQLMNGGKVLTVTIPSKPVRREPAMRAIERAFGVKIFQGKPFKIRKALGYFRTSTGEVRIKKHNDLEVTAHEFFHWLDRTYPALRRLYHEPKYRAELKGVSYDQKLLFEGFAEFGRLFLTKEPEAATRLPTFYPAFVAAIEREGLLEKFVEAQKLMHAWYLQGAEGRALSKIGPEVRSFKEWWKESTDGLVDREIQTAFDWLQSIKVAERTVTGDIQDATVSPYGATRLLAGARGVVKAVLNRGTIAFDAAGDIVFTGKGLRQVMEPVTDEFDAAMAYFVGKRADELRGQGRENLLDKDEIDALLRIGQRSPKFEQIKEAFDELQLFWDRMGEFYIQSGIVSRKSWQIMRDANKNYLPFNRILESLESPEGGKPAPGFRRLRGGTQNLRETWENIVGSINVQVGAALRNHAKTLLYRTIESNLKGQKFAVAVPTEKHGTIVNARRILEQISRSSNFADPRTKQAFDDMLDAIENDQGLAEAVMYWSGKYQPSAPDIDMVLIKGEPKYFQIGDPLLMETLELWNNPKQAELALRIIGGFSGTLRRGVTMALDFLVPNALRSTFSAATMSRGGQLPFIGTLRGMKKSLMKEDEYWEFLANGGGFASFAHADPQTLRKRMERYYVDKKIDYRTVLDTPQKILDAYDDFTSVFEYGTRVEEYRTNRKKGVSRRQSALEGRDIDTDFGMRGSSELLRWITTGVPFMNARLEGLYRLERQIFEKKGKQRIIPNGKRAASFAIKALFLLTVPSIALWLKQKDDPRYKQLPAWLKATHWPIITDDKVYLIPHPFETGAMFASIPVQTLEYIADKDGEKYAEAIAFLVTETFAMDPTPQLVKPFVDLARNKDFTGKPIVGKQLEGIDPEEQFTPFTSDTAIRVGKMFGVSPVKLDYLARGYIGTLGQYSMSLADMMVDPDIGTGEKPAKKFGENYVVRRFVREYPIRGTEQEQEFYDLLEETRQVVSTFNKVKGEARQRDAELYLTAKEKQVIFGARSSVEGIQKQAAAINAGMNAVRLNPNLTADQKRAELDALQLKKNMLFDLFTSEFKRRRAEALAELPDDFEISE